MCLGRFLVAYGLYTIKGLLGVAEALDPGAGRTDVMMLFSMAPLVLQFSSCFHLCMMTPFTQATMNKERTFLAGKLVNVHKHFLL